MHAWAAIKGSPKICILIIINRGWQCKVGREQFNPLQSEDPSRFEVFVYIKMLTTESTKQVFNLSIYRTLSEKKILL